MCACQTFTSNLAHRIDSTAAVEASALRQIGIHHDCGPMHDGLHRVAARGATVGGRGLCRHWLVPLFRGRQLASPMKFAAICAHTNVAKCRLPNSALERRRRGQVVDTGRVDSIALGCASETAWRQLERQKREEMRYNAWFATLERTLMQRIRSFSVKMSGPPATAVKSVPICP